MGWRVNNKERADAQRPLVIDRCVVIAIQVIPNAAVPLVRAFLMDLLHHLSDTLVLGNTGSGFPERH